MNKWVVCIVLLAILFTAAGYFIYFIDLPYHPATAPGGPETWGQFGDFFGGVLNPLVAFAALVALFAEMRRTQGYMKDQLDEFEEQRTKNELHRIISDCQGRLTSLLNQKVGRDLPGVGFSPDRAPITQRRPRPPYFAPTVRDFMMNDTLEDAKNDQENLWWLGSLNTLVQQLGGSIRLYEATKSGDEYTGYVRAIFDIDLFWANKNGYLDLNVYAAFCDDDRFESFKSEEPKEGN